jgi:hypothetical protein
MPASICVMSESQERVEMTTYSNEAVLEALRRVQYRQVPWARRPGVFEYLRGLGLMDTVRQRTVAPGAGFHAPVDIAVLTERGRAEFARLAREERSLGWSAQRAVDYSPKAIRAAVADLRA